MSDRSAGTLALAMMLAVALSAPMGAAQEQTAGGETRAFRMGFTPFPHDISLQALEDTREMLRADGDLVAAHFEGVPWPEALSGEPLPGKLLSEWERCREALGPGGVIYLALTPLDLGRSQMAPSRGETSSTRVRNSLVRALGA